MKKVTGWFTIIILTLLSASILNSCNNQKRIPQTDGRVEQNIISIRTARAYTANFRRGRSEVISQLKDPAYLDKNFQLPVAVQFNRDVLALLLKQKDSSGNIADGIRFYFARNDQNQVTLVLVPYDRKNNDILNQLIDKDVVSVPGISSAQAQPRLNAQAVDNALRCPTFCDQSNSGLGSGF
jgi:hypothetical protein